MDLEKQKDNSENDINEAQVAVALDAGYENNLMWIVIHKCN